MVKSCGWKNLIGSSGDRLGAIDEADALNHVREQWVAVELAP